MQIKTNKEVLPQLDKLEGQKENFKVSDKALSDKHYFGFFPSVGKKKSDRSFFYFYFLQVLVEKDFLCMFGQ